MVFPGILLTPFCNVTDSSAALFSSVGLYVLGIFFFTI